MLVAERHRRDRVREGALNHHGDASPYGTSSFHRVVWLAPAAYLLHFLEEALGFPRWVAATFGVEFSTIHFLRNGTIFFSVLVLLCFLSKYVRNMVFFLLFFSWVFGHILHNAVFHVGAMIWLRGYAPGVATGVALYLPLSAVLVHRALRERLLTTGQALLAFLLGGVAHYAVIFNQLGGWNPFP